MKYIFLTLAIISCNIVNAQTIELIYQETFKMATISNIEHPELEIIIQQELERNKQRKKYLIYNDGGSIYKEKVEYSKTNFHDSNTEIIKSGGSNIIYKDLNGKVIVSRKYILDKAFLIKEPLVVLKWELKNKKKKIGDYDCLKAVIGENITAWYCPDIPINDGPNIYWGLPGLIVELDTPDTFYSLISIKTNNDRSSEIVPPTDGKEVSSEEFKKIEKEKLGDGKGIIIQVDEM